MKDIRIRDKPNYFDEMDFKPLLLMSIHTSEFDDDLMMWTPKQRDLQPGKNWWWILVYHPC